MHTRFLSGLSALLFVISITDPAFAADDPAAPTLKCTVSWIGNSFSGKSQWVLQDVEDLFVDSDGTLFTNVVWDEAGGNVEEYRDANLIHIARHTHGWGYEGGSAVAANAKYVFIAQRVGNEGGGLRGDSWPAKGLGWSGVSRRLRANCAKAAPFEGGHGKEGDVLKGSFLPVLEFPDAKGTKAGNVDLRGLWATDTQLFVSSPFDGTIKIYDVETMKPAGSWKVDRPDKLCVDRGGKIWVLQRPAEPDGVWKAICFGADRTPQAQSITFDKAVIPTDLCTDARGRLLVADAGPDQQVKVYEHLDTTPTPGESIGAKGGILAGPVPGQFGDLRFNRPRGVGADAKGNIFVASSGSVAGGSTVIECYGPDLKLLWRRMGLTFVDLAAVDPSSETDVFSKEEHFALDYAKPAGEEWSYRGYTVDRFKYPDDPRLHLSPTTAWVRNISGRRFLFVSDMTGDFLHVYRFDPATSGETAIPCALFAKKHINSKDGYPAHQPAKGEWAWIDLNGDGRIDAGEYAAPTIPRDATGIYTPDEQGNVWQSSGKEIRRIPMAGLSKAGIPVWDFAQARAWPKPAELDEVRRVHHLPATDTMLLGGNRGEDHNQHWKPMGPVLCCFDKWSTDARATRWTTVLPYKKGSSGHESAEPISFDVAGDYVFVAYTRGLGQTKGQDNAFVRVLKLSDGSPVGSLTCDEQLGEIGLLDLVESVHATKRSNGEYVVLLEDDAKSKVVMFRWMP